jgi:hypothetical protein
MQELYETPVCAMARLEYLDESLPGIGYQATS